MRVQEVYEAASFDWCPAIWTDEGWSIFANFGFKECQRQNVNVASSYLFINFEQICKSTSRKIINRRLKSASASVDKVIADLNAVIDSYDLMYDAYEIDESREILRKAISQAKELAEYIGIIDRNYPRATLAMINNWVVRVNEAAINSGFRLKQSVKSEEFISILLNDQSKYLYQYLIEIAKVEIGCAFDSSNKLKSYNAKNLIRSLH